MVQARFRNEDHTLRRTYAKSNVTAIKQAYNSRSQAPGCTAISKRVMTNLSKILSLENVQLDLEVSSKKRAFEQAGLIFENNCGIARSTVSDNLFARERLGSTGLGHGVAVP